MGPQPFSAQVSGTWGPPRCRSMWIVLIPSHLGEFWFSVSPCSTEKALTRNAGSWVPLSETSIQWAQGPGLNIISKYSQRILLQVDPKCIVRKTHLLGLCLPRPLPLSRAPFHPHTLSTHAPEVSLGILRECCRSGVTCPAVTESHFVYSGLTPV